MRLLPVLVVALLAGCGGALDSEFSGTWSGTTTVAFTGMSPDAYAGRVVATVRGTSVTLASVCPAGDGSIYAEGADNTAEWDGALTCQPVAYAGCSGVALTFTSGIATLNSNGTLSLQGVGVGSGCGTSRPVTVTFTGRK